MRGLPVPILWALSGTFVGKWFSDFDDYACISVTFVMAAVVVIPIALAIAYSPGGQQSEKLFPVSSLFFPFDPCFHLPLIPRNVALD